MGFAARRANSLNIPRTDTALLALHLCKERIVHNFTAVHVLRMRAARTLQVSYIFSTHGINRAWRFVEFEILCAITQISLAKPRRHSNIVQRRADVNQFRRAAGGRPRGHALLHYGPPSAAAAATHLSFPVR